MKIQNIFLITSLLLPFSFIKNSPKVEDVLIYYENDPSSEERVFNDYDFGEITK